MARRNILKEVKHTTIEVKEILVTDGNITSKDLPPYHYVR